MLHKNQWKVFKLFKVEMNLFVLSGMEVSPLPRSYFLNGVILQKNNG